MNIGDLSIGDQAKIISYLPSDRHYRKKLLIMGLTPGTVITLVGVAPLGDPVEISIRGQLIGLRKTEAKIIQLEKVST